jgi:hypothetical protein
METDASDTADPRAMRWWIAACSVALVVILTGQLLWLAYRFVPMHAAVFEGMGMELPLDARIVIAAANWVIRMVPFLVLAGVPLGGLAIVGVAIVAPKVPMRTVVGAVTGVGLTIALAQCSTSAFVVHAIHSVYAKAATSKEYQQSLREIDECRREKRSSPGKVAPEP